MHVNYSVDKFRNVKSCIYIYIHYDKSLLLQATHVYCMQDRVVKHVKCSLLLYLLKTLFFMLV